MSNINHFNADIRELARSIRFISEEIDRGNVVAFAGVFITNTKGTLSVRSGQVRDNADRLISSLESIKLKVLQAIDADSKYFKSLEEVKTDAESIRGDEG